MANYSAEIDTLIRAYFRGTLTEVQQKTFESRLQTDSEFSEAFSLEKEMRFFFKAYTYHKMQEADLMIQAIEKANPLATNPTENTDNQPTESNKKWFGLGFLLLICLGFVYYFYAFNASNASEKKTISSVSQQINATPENTKDLLATTIVAKDTHPKRSAAVKIPPKNAENTVFDDSLKSYLFFEKTVKKSQNELISLLKNNLSMNRILIDTLKALTACEHQKNNFSLAAPKFVLLSDSLVLDSIRLVQVFATPPQNLLALQDQKNRLQQWENVGVFRKKEAYERNEALQIQLIRFSQALKDCRE